MIYLAVSDHIQQGNDVRPSGKVLQDLDLPLDLLLLDRFQDLDNTLLVIDDIDAFKDFRVLSPSWIESYY